MYHLVALWCDSYHYVSFLKQFFSEERLRNFVLLRVINCHFKSEIQWLPSAHGTQRLLSANAQIRMMKTADVSRCVSKFKIGDNVFGSTKNLALVGPNKFKPKYIGPFVILKMRARGNAVQLALPPELVKRCIHDVFNVDLLKFAVSRPTHLGPPLVTNPPPLCEDTSGVYYALDFILEEKMHSPSKGLLKVLFYLCRWKGYGAAGDTWEPATIIQAGSPEAVSRSRSRSRNLF